MGRNVIGLDRMISEKFEKLKFAHKKVKQMQSRQISGMRVEAAGWQRRVSGSGPLSVGRPQPPRGFCCAAADCVCFSALQVQSQPLPRVTSARAGAPLSAPDKPGEISEPAASIQTYCVFHLHVPADGDNAFCQEESKTESVWFRNAVCLFFSFFPFSFLPQVLRVTQNK